jgi:diguanylate cyclase (GGDEF)-like protein
VVTSYDSHSRRHEVLATRLSASAQDDRAWSKLDARLRGLSFPDGEGLVSIAVKNRHFVPVAGEFPDADAVVFDPGSKLKNARSLLVLPLLRGDQVLGTLILATHKERAYREQTREMLRVIGHQVAVSLQNARMYQSMEQRATTDGLTGLLNHRSFQERLEQLHDLAERGDRTYSVILTDIDHFKSVNDTYGHPAGDAVLKRVSALFDRSARKVDIVARYGGEEFVLVLPDTDGEGAELFANRLREDVAAQSMTSEHGTFNCTISMGIAEFPRDGADRAELIRFADQALYWSKEHGRNRVTRFAQI